MEHVLQNEAFVLRSLQWDTEFFGIPCAKAVLLKALTDEHWNVLCKEMGKYQFITIENRDSNPMNALLIGENSSAFLTDTNVQFIKQPTQKGVCSSNVRLFRAMKRDDRILDMTAVFNYSRFACDPYLHIRNGSDIYKMWVLNAFEKGNKIFSIFYNNSIPSGFLLYSFENEILIIELIAVSTDQTHVGVGTNLLQSVESEAYMKGCKVLKVGTQGRNMSAINFYHKYGFKEVGCHQIYHLWEKHTC